MDPAMPYESGAQQQQPAPELRRKRRAVHRAQQQAHLFNDHRDRLALGQGLYLLVTGVWPLVHYRSFEWVTGTKKDDWLVRCVGGLGVTIGFVQLRSVGTDEGRRIARQLGMGAALTFGAIDLVYGGRGRISRIYLLDAAVEAAWFTTWLRAGTVSPRGAGQP